MRLQIICFIDNGCFVLFDQVVSILCLLKWHFRLPLSTQRPNKRPLGLNLQLKRRPTSTEQEAYGPHSSPEKTVQINIHILLS